MTINNQMILYIITIFLILCIWNVTLLLKLNAFMTSWDRFTYEDWIAIYSLSNEWYEIDIAKTLDIYEWKTTPFKEFLLLNHHIE